MTSDPFWTPPPIESSKWFPQIGGIDAILALTAAMGWPEPSHPRKGLQPTLHPLVSHSREAREHLRNQQGSEALKVIISIIRAFPLWPGGWKLAAEGFLMLNQPEQAKQWLDRVNSIRSAS
tara:strand:- start:314 stop:676 length:363 start_codon:yes stop_codon:yes gene_type:complete